MIDFPVQYYSISCWKAGRMISSFRRCEVCLRGWMLRNIRKIKIVSNCDVDECMNDASGRLWTMWLCESYCRNLYFRVPTTHAVDHHKVFKINKINFRLLSYGISANRSKVDLRGSWQLTCYMVPFPLEVFSYEKLTNAMIHNPPTFFMISQIPAVNAKRPSRVDWLMVTERSFVQYKMCSLEPKTQKASLHLWRRLYDFDDLPRNRPISDSVASLAQKKIVSSSREIYKIPSQVATS